MHPAHKLSGSTLAASFPVCIAICIFLSGCGTPGAPMPPTLNLPAPVTNLAAVRAGNQVTLTWKMPKKSTDKLLLKGDIPVHICRKENSGACVPVPANLIFAPEATGTFTEDLPPALTTGDPRVLTYFVELINKNGRSAGLSNPAVALAGQAPTPVANFSAKVIKAGVVLRWTPDNASEAIRLHRKLLSPQPASQDKQNPASAPPEPLEQNLLVDPAEQTEQTSNQAPSRAPDRALDKDIRFGQVYEYRAQRVARITVEGKTLELSGPFSDPIRVEVRDIFPPATPTGLAAVATLAQPGVETAIDLSWQPVTDTDLAGYAVYRREGDSPWQRITPAQPIVAPGFHDNHVQPGHTYHYAVTAIDQDGHESPRSAETEETVPTP
ncbi:MAG: fibronectin type III domain-containing protein [Terracidiphilus sp.]